MAQTSIYDPEAALRKKLQTRVTGVGRGVPPPLQDPVWGMAADTSTPAPPPLPVATPMGAPIPTTAVAAPVLPLPGAVLPGAPVTAPVAATPDVARPSVTGEPTPPRPSPTTPTPTPTPPPSTFRPTPWTFDPRLGTDPVWANSPEGLAEANRQDAFHQMMQVRLYPGPQGGDFRSWFQKVTQGMPPSPDFLKFLEPHLNQWGMHLAPNAAGVNGKIRLPSGEIIDVIEAAGAGGKAWQWLQGGSSGGGATPMPGGQSDFQKELRRILMERLAAAQKPVSDTDLNIAQPFGAAKLEAERNQQMERTALAERLAANGDTSQSLERGIMQSSERNAVGLGSLKAKLVQDEYTKRRSELLDLMQMAMASNDAQAARDIQLAMIALDKAKFQVTHNSGVGN